MESTLSASFQFLFLALFLVPCILFLLTQQKTLNLIQPVNRSISPGEIFLQLIPLFGMVWQFFVVARIAKSIDRELAEQTFSFERTDSVEYATNSRPTYAIGITYCILFCASLIPFNPTVKLLFSLATITCWIIYWVQLAIYKSKLKQKFYLLASPSSRP
jgi:hypothetical protein